MKFAKQASKMADYLESAAKQLRKSIEVVAMLEGQKVVRRRRRKRRTKGVEKK